VVFEPTPTTSYDCGEVPLGGSAGAAVLAGALGATGAAMATPAVPAANAARDATVAAVVSSLVNLSITLPPGNFPLSNSARSWFAGCAAFAFMTLPGNRLLGKGTEGVGEIIS
jgi:hypothetical protein